MVALESGFWTVGRARGAALRLHWTIPVGALMFSGFRFAPAFWAAFFGLVLFHELGHAAVVRVFGHRVLSIDVFGFGGLCRWSGAATPFERAAIAWGGVLAQALILIVTQLLILFMGPPRSLAVAEIVYVFTWTNLLIIGLNLLPIPPLDGAEAWPLVKHLRDGFRFRRSRPRSRDQRRDAGRGAKGSRPSEARRPHSGASGAEQHPEIAEMLRRVAEEAGRARRGQ